MIGTHHGELGSCNSGQLIEILEALNPQVAFFEASPYQFTKFLQISQRLEIPEIQAVSMLMERGIAVIPIDILDPLNDSLESMMALFKKMPEYNAASKIQFLETERLGYPYLNSEECDKIHRDKITMEDMYVRRIGNDRLINTHKEWRQWNEDRENHWINEIRSYSLGNNFQNAVLIAGSAHRIGLMEKIKKQKIDDESISWDFFHFDHCN